MSAAVAFAVAAALHLGFQATVTALVYPTLARVGQDAWTGAHERHSRGVVPLVALSYGALVGTGAWLLVTAPSPLALAAVGAGALAVLVTAVSAAPLHGRLSSPEPALLGRLLRADRLRAASAVVCLVLALVVVASSG